MTGDLYAILTAFVWSTAVIFFRQSSMLIGSLSLKVFQGLVAVLLLFLCLWVLGEDLWPSLSRAEWLRLSVSAFIGITIGDLLYQSAVRRLGAGGQALVDGLYSPMVIGIAYLYLAESPSPYTLLGGAFIISSIWFGSQLRKVGKVPTPDLVNGIIFGASSQLCMAICVLMIRDDLRQHSVLTYTAYRFLFGTLIMAAHPLFVGQAQTLWRELQTASRSFSVWAGAVLGPFLSTLLWFSGFKHTTAAKAAVYNQLSTVFIILLAAVFLREPLTLRKGVALALSVLGGFIVHLANA